MTPPSSENRSGDDDPAPPINARADVLRRLRATPELFARISEWQGNELALQERLRAEFADDVVREALSLSELRRRAKAKFTRASHMWFDRVGLEQSTSEPVARHKAQRFEGPVWDYCCGIGGDAIVLGERCEVIAVDRNPASCLCTEYNAEVYGVSDRVTTRCADVESLAEQAGLLHIDPDRRSGAARQTQSGRRSLRMEEGSPSLEFLTQITERFRGGAVKASPAANFGGKFPFAEIELVSLEGECKEATIWFGELAEPGLWRATALPSGETIAGDPLASVAAVSPLSKFLFDPDPALVRAGLIDRFALQAGLARLDDEEEYLSGEESLASPFVRPFEVVAELPNNDREIRRYFRGSGIGRLEIKCRRIPIDVESLRRKLPLSGPSAAVLIFARVNGRARALVCRRVAFANAVDANRPAPAN
jgi:hypothetical protein